MGLEEAFYGSTAIRNFLKLFSNAHEKRVSKATFLIGITRLAEIAEKKGRQSIASLTVDDIEKLALKVHERYIRNKRAKTAGDNIIPVYENLDTTDKKRSSAKKRYRHGKQFASPDSSKYLQESQSVVQDSQMNYSPKRPSSLKKRAGSSEERLSRQYVHQQDAMGNGINRPSNSQEAQSRSASRRRRM